MWPTLLLLPLLAGPNQVSIDRDWLKARGSGPYLLNRPGTTYVLKTDVRTPSTAFVIDASDVVLDLNGHKVTYGDSPPVTVRNGGFEEGSGRKVPGWDLTDAPSAELVPNTTFLFGKQVLRLKGFRTVQKFLSDPITVPVTRQQHAAIITPSRAHYRTNLQLSVLDADSRRPIGQGRSPNVERGASAVAYFQPGSVRTIRLLVEVSPPPAGEAVNLDLDEAQVVVTHDHGIVATNASREDVPGWNQLIGAVGPLSRRVSNFTLKNGSVVQGRGRALGGSPLYFAHLRGLSVEEVETFANGTDTTTLNATAASGRVVIRKCTLRHEVENITDRYRLFSAIRLANVTGPVQVENNELLRVPQVGISLSGGGPDRRIVIRKNHIHQQAVATNAYALLLSSTQNFEIAHNMIVAENGRGISFDGYGKAPIQKGDIHHNEVEVREKPNREYWSGQEARALRMRNTEDRKGPQRDLLIRANTFTAITGDGLAPRAFAAMISYQNRDGSMTDANVRLVDNTFRAITTSRDPKSRASALVFDGLAPKVGLHLRDNIMESNDAVLTLGEMDAGVEELKLIGNTFRKPKEGAERPWYAIRAGYWDRVIRDTSIIAPRLEEGASLTIDWVGIARKELMIGQLLSVTVRQGEDAVTGAEVSVRDREGKVVFTGKTDENGQVRDISLVTMRYEQRTEDARKISKEERGLFRISATKAGRSVSEEIALRRNQELTLQFPSR
jgi:hypothetical protein